MGLAIKCEALLNLGKSYEGLRQYDKAEDSYRKFLEITESLFKEDSSEKTLALMPADRALRRLKGVRFSPTFTVMNARLSTGRNDAAEMGVIYDSATGGSGSPVPVYRLLRLEDGRWKVIWSSSRPSARWPHVRAGVSFVGHRAKELKLMQKPLGQRWQIDLNDPLVERRGPIKIISGPAEGVEISFVEKDGHYLISSISR
ncbi:tetratricopeptide repeat protein [Thermoanaerobacterium sp. DL9XJH110]|uniref:tetratricopeptide repeat protein n=1 Tax=Thermoanaerobacterium sp. DL9XJH110 TaxID=3386643 RepID=UPI003BB4F241